MKKIDSIKFDRAYFKEFGESRLILEIVYYVLNSEYKKYVDIQQKINWGIKEAFEKEGIRFI